MRSNRSILPSGRRLRNGGKSNLHIAAIAILFAGMTLAAQAPPASHDSRFRSTVSPSEHPWAFDVISIRPTKPDDSGRAGVFPNEYVAIGIPLSWTVIKAYFPMAYFNKDRILGLPSWVFDDKYTIVAKVAASDLAEWQKQSQKWGQTEQNEMLQAMLQKLLAERCHLVVHWIPGESKGYLLKLSKNDRHLKALRDSKPDEVLPPGAMRIPLGGVIVPIVRGQAPNLSFFHTSMAALAANLSFGVGYVEDRTGLTGTYDFALPRGELDQDPATIWDVGALGLRLEQTKVPMDVLVVDRIERPSTN